MCRIACLVFFNDTATTEIYTLSLHDALPIFTVSAESFRSQYLACDPDVVVLDLALPRSDGVELLRFLAEEKRDRKSTRLNSSHANISYAVFCLKKKKNILVKNLLMKSAMRLI